MLYALLTRTNSHLSVLHVRAPLYTQTAEGGIRNGYTLRFSNKLSEPSDFALEVSGVPGATVTSVVAKPLADGRLGGPRRSRRDARSPGLCDDVAGRESDRLDPDHLHRHRRQDRRAQRRGRPFLRSMIRRGDR